MIFISSKGIIGEQESPAFTFVSINPITITINFPAISESSFYIGLGSENTAILQKCDGSENIFFDGQQWQTK